jgi:prepilin-type N-terminal cleavage/methylation domain-containing protein
MNQLLGVRGFTLTELLVAMTINLFILSGTLKLSASSHALYQQIVSQTALLENNAFAVSYLQSFFYSNIHSHPTSTQITSCLENCHDLRGQQTIGSWIELSDTNNRLSDCSGRESRRITRKRLFIQTDRIDHNRPALYCQTNIGHRKVIIANVENMRVAYAVDSNADGMADQSRFSISASESSMVMSISIGLLIGEPKMSRTSQSRQQFLLAGQAVISPSDKRIRTVLNATLNHVI